MQGYIYGKADYYEAHTKPDIYVSQCVLGSVSKVYERLLELANLVVGEEFGLYTVDNSVTYKN